MNNSSLTVSAAIVLLANYVLNLYGVQPMPPDVTIAAGVVVHAVGVLIRSYWPKVPDPDAKEG